MRFHLFIPTAALVCVACASNDGADNSGATPAAIAPNFLVLVVGQSGAVNAHALSANGDTLPGNTFTWSTSNPAVVTVSSAGLATAHAAGTAAIRGTSGSAIGTATITVITPHAVTLLVTNGTCVGTQCDSLDILAFPGTQPRTPAGLWRLALGSITAQQKCLVIPPFATFTINAADPTGARIYTTTWNATGGLSLAGLPPSASGLQASPSTDSFVPSATRGWRITLPGGGAPVPAEPCVP